MCFVNNHINFIYMHPQKCAGGSLSNLLQEHFREGLLGVSINNRQFAHSNFSDILHLTNKPLNKYFKFAVTRNTWDRVVSMYFHVKKHRDYHGSFEDFVLRDGISGKGFLINFKMKPRLTLDNQYIIDFAIRYENFKQDVDYVMNYLGVRDYNLTHVTHGTARNGIDYRILYNQETIDFVNNAFKWEINKFNYTF